MRLTIDFQTGAEEVFIGIHDSKENFIIAGTHGAKCPALGKYRFCLVLGSAKNTAGDTSYFEQPAWQGEQRLYVTQEFRIAELAKELPQPLVLQLRKQGRSFIASVIFQAAGGEEFELEKLVSLRAPKDLVIGVRQVEDVEGETVVTVDWVKIESVP
jgi:hypothetical protein